MSELAQYKQEKLEFRPDIPVDKIQPNPHQPRTIFDEEKMEELKASIRVKGVVQPITVRNISTADVEAYELVAGERRWRACEGIGRATIPGFVIEVSDKDAMDLAFVENVQREGLTNMEEARGLAVLVDNHGGNKTYVAEEILGKSLTYINDRLALLELPEEVQNMVDRGQVSVAQAKVLLAVEDPEKQIHWAKMAQRLNLNANQLKGRTQNLIGNRGKSSIRDKRERQVSFKSLTAGMISLYEDVEVVADLGKFSLEQRSTLAQQISILTEALGGLREKLLGPVGESAEDVNDMEEEEVAA